MMLFLSINGSDFDFLKIKDEYIYLLKAKELALNLKNVFYLKPELI